MRYFFITMLFGLFLNAEVLDIYNRTKTEPFFKKSERYVAYVKRGDFPPVIERQTNSKEKENKLLERGYKKISVYEDSSSWWIPSGKLTMRLYTSPKLYQPARYIEKYFGFEGCKSTDMENYICETLNDNLLKRFVLNKLEIEKKEKARINIEYFHLFK